MIGRKETGMKKGLLLLGLLLLLPLRVMAETPPALFVADARMDEAITSTGRPLDAISLFDVQGDRYLFLPAFADASALRVLLEGTDRVTVNGQTLANGEVTGLFVPGETLRVTLSQEAFELTVCQSENLPAVFLFTESGESAYIHASKDNREPGAVLLVEADGGVACEQTLSQIRIRGNSTTQYEKKAYQIRLEEKQALLGMDADRTWVLLANYIDRSLLRNTLALRLASAAGIAYTPESTPVDVYLNNEYMGNYLLCEKVETGEGRVEIDDLEEATDAVNAQALDSYAPAGYGLDASRNSRQYGYGEWRPTPDTWRAIDIPQDPADITGGYLLEVGVFRDWAEQPSAFVLHSGWPLAIKEPEYASVAQTLYIRDRFQHIDSAISDGDWATLSGLIDVDSWVRKYVLEELLGNYDGGTGSQYFYKRSGDPLIYCGPPWDYDNILGVNSTVGQPDGFYVNRRAQQPGAVFPRLWTMEAFRTAARETYRKVYQPLVEALLGEANDPGGAIQTLASCAEEIRASAEMNFIRWPIDYSYHRQVQSTGGSYQENVDFLSDFLRRRAAFLNESWAFESE